jgi:hypothetical protein
MRALPEGGRNIGMIGLGVGTLAAYGKSGDHFFVYEINPEVLRLAASRFSYLSNCPATLEIVAGDARLSMEKSPARNLDLLVIDAFNSDAIPVHLLTREAFAIYRRHLKTNGVFAIHITNRSLNLEPVVVNLAREFGYRLAIVDQEPPPGKWWVAENLWVLLSGNAEFINTAVVREAARPVRSDLPRVALWTDDFVSLFPILRGKRPMPDPAFEEAQFQLARSCGERGDFAGAAEVFRNAVRTRPDSATLHNNLAYLLATSPDVRVRNGAESVVHAERACELSDYKLTVMISTLALAYAEAGRTEDAIVIAEKASALAAEFGEEELVRRNQDLVFRLRRNSQ